MFLRPGLVVEGVTFDPPVGFANMIYRWKARDEQIGGVNRQARFAPPSGSDWANPDAVSSVFWLIALRARRCDTGGHRSPAAGPW